MLLFIGLFAIALFIYYKQVFGYWAKRNVKHEFPIPIFGTHFNVLFRLKSLGTACEHLYKKYKNERFIGYYHCHTPTLLVNDPDMVRCILNTDFLHFNTRGATRNQDKQFLEKNLVLAEGDQWKLYRQRLTPAFTISKLKKMFPLVIECAQKLQCLCEDIVATGEEYDIRELMARYTLNFVGACGFGIEMNSMNKERSTFLEMGRSVFLLSGKNAFLYTLAQIAPGLTKNMYIGRRDVENTMFELFENVRKQRNYKPIGRNDFMDILLELEQQGELVGTSIEKTNSDGTPAIVKMDMEVKALVAQVYLFFVAGFETSAATTSNFLHQMAFHPDIQRKIQNEIDDVLSRYDNKLCYEAISEMTYLEMALQEAMRLFSVAGAFQRTCTKKYTFPGTNITIDPGVKILIPIQAIQNDEKYFDNPTEFRPERFLPELVQERNKYVNLPFGEGPRNCVGARMGLMQSLAGLVAVLHKYSVEPSKSTVRHQAVDPKSFRVESVLGGVPLKLVRRK